MGRLGDYHILESLYYRIFFTHVIILIPPLCLEESVLLPGASDASSSVQPIFRADIEWERLRIFEKTEISTADRRSVASWSRFRPEVVSHRAGYIWRRTI